MAKCLTSVRGGSGGDSQARDVVAAALVLKLGDTLDLARADSGDEAIALAEDGGEELGDAATKELGGQTNAAADVSLSGLSDHESDGDDDSGGLHFDGLRKFDDLESKVVYEI